MTTNGRLVDRPPTPASEEEAFFASSEGLRSVLLMLADIGPGAWRQMPVAANLMRYCERRYSPLALAWRREPADAAFAAFEVMRTDAVLLADEPWAVVTKAIEMALARETAGDRFLMAPEKARKRTGCPPSAPVRAGEHEEFLLGRPAEMTSGNRLGDEQLDQAAAFLSLAGFAPEGARAMVDQVCSKLADTMDTAKARRKLRAETQFANAVGLDRETWLEVVTILIGGRLPGCRVGVLARIALGHQLADLLADTDLFEAAQSAARTVTHSTGQGG